MNQTRQLHTTLVSQSSTALQPACTALTLTNPTGSGQRKRKETSRSHCREKPKWSSSEIKMDMKHWRGKYTELQAECRRHGVSQNGTSRDMLQNLRAHYLLPHQDVARSAQRMAFADLFRVNG